MGLKTDFQGITSIGEKGIENENALIRLRTENASRIPCRHCQTPILPANLARHESLHLD